MKKYVKATSDEDKRLWKQVIQKCKEAGIDVTSNKYEMMAEKYMRYGAGANYTIRFSAPGNYFAYTAMYIHQPLNIDNLLEFIEDQFGGIQDMLDEYPSEESMKEYASAVWYGDGDDYIFYLKNTTTGELLYEGDAGDIYEDEDYEDWDD